MAMSTKELDFLRIETMPVTLREIALDRMRRAIISGVFEPGERLVERSLCDQMGVSRSVIREVIRHLEAEGLVEMLQRQGPIVASLDGDDARQIYEIRGLLEAKAVADCARGADPAVKVALTQAFAALQAASKEADPMAIIDATTLFYKIIFHAGHNTMAWEVVTRLNSRISRLRVMTLSTSGRMTSGPAQLKRIFDAILAGDPEAAAEACHAHVAAAAEIADRLLSKEMAALDQ